MLSITTVQPIYITINNKITLMPEDPNDPSHIVGIFTGPMCHFVAPADHNDEEHKDFSTIRRYRLRILREAF
jgi:hypothetical protein